MIERAQELRVQTINFRATTMLSSPQSTLHKSLAQRRQVESGAAQVIEQLVTMRRLQGRDGTSIGLLLTVAIMVLASGAAPVSTEMRDKRAANLRSLWADTSDSLGELAAAKNATREHQVNSASNSNSNSNSHLNSSTSQLSSAEADQWEASSNETTTYGPLLELNAIQAAERGYFRHSTSASVIVTIAYALVFIIGLIGNSFVVAIVCKSPRMRTVTNYFIANLALADILVLLFCLPATLVGNLFIPYVLGEWVCKTVSYLQGVAVSASINTMMAVTLDRFLAICFPMDWHMSRRTARRVIACIWLFSLTIALPWALFFKLAPYPHETIMLEICVEAWPTASWGKLYFVFANLVLLYLFPAVVITFCYLGIWYKIERRNIPGDQPKGLKIELIMQKSKLKVIKMMMLVVLIFLLSWFPTYIIFVRIKLFDSNSLSELEDWIIQNTMPFAQWLGASNSCINPILYTFFNRKYKRGLIDLLRCAFCCRPPTKMGATLSDQSHFGEASTSRPLKYEHRQGRERRHQRLRGVQNGALSMMSLNATPLRSSNGRPTCQSTTISTDVHTSNNGQLSSKQCEQPNCDRKSEASSGQAVRAGLALHEQGVNQTDTNASESCRQHSKRSRSSRQVGPSARRQHKCGCKSRRRTKSAGTNQAERELVKAKRDSLESEPVATATLSSSTPILGGASEPAKLLAASSHEANERRKRFIGSHGTRSSGSCSLHHCLLRPGAATPSESMARSDCCVDRRHRQQPLLSGVNEDDDDDQDSKVALSTEESGWPAGKRSSCDEQPRRQSDNSNNTNTYGHQISQIKQLSRGKRAVSGDAVNGNVQDRQQCICVDITDNNNNNNNNNNKNNSLAGTRQTRFGSEGHMRHRRHHRGHRHRPHTCSKRRSGASRGSQSHDCVNKRPAHLAADQSHTDVTSLTDDTGPGAFEEAPKKKASKSSRSHASELCNERAGDLLGRSLNSTNSSNNNTRDTNTTTESTEVITLSPANQASSLICMDSISLVMEHTTNQSKHINLASAGACSTDHASRSLVNKMRSALDKSVESSPDGHVPAITDCDRDDNRHDEHCELKARCLDQQHELDDLHSSTEAFGADEDGSTTGDYAGLQEDEEAELEFELELELEQEEDEEEEEDLLFGSEEDSPSRLTRIERLRCQQSELNEQLRKKHERARKGGPSCKFVATSQRQLPTGRAGRAGRLIVGDEISGYQVAIMSLATSSSNLANLAMQKLGSSCKFARRRTTSGFERSAAKRGSLSPSGLNEHRLVGTPESRALLSGQNGHSLSSRFSWECRAERETSCANNHASGPVNMQNDMKPAGAGANMSSSCIKCKRRKQCTTSAGQIIKSNVMRGHCNIALGHNRQAHQLERLEASSARLGEQTSLLSSSTPVSATDLA